MNQQDIDIDFLKNQFNNLQVMNIFINNCHIVEQVNIRRKHCDNW